MAEPRPGRFFSVGIRVCVLGLLLLAAACGGKQQVEPPPGAPEGPGSVPLRIAVMPVAYEQPSANGTKSGRVIADHDVPFVEELVRGVIRNHLAVKGYLVPELELVDDRLQAMVEKGARWQDLPPAELCSALGVQGLATIRVTELQMVRAVAVDSFHILAELEVTDDSGTVTGSWSDSATRRNVSVPTGIFSAIATVIKAVIDDPAEQQMRLVIYDWAWKIADAVPSSPKAGRLPRVAAVESNVDRRVFKAGERVEVAVRGDKGLMCSFHVGSFKRNIPMPATDEGVYQGFYAVREGDAARDEAVSIRLLGPGGVERVWVEPGPGVTLDGVPPQAPRDIRASAGRDGVRLEWRHPGEEELRGFVVEKSEALAGNYTMAGEARDTSFTDPKARQGGTSYYRVRAVDLAGNLSPAGPPAQVLAPHFDAVRLEGALKGRLVPGLYDVAGPAEVPAGEALTIMPGATLRFARAAGLAVKGRLEARGGAGSQVRFEGPEWSGLDVAQSGSLDLEQAALAGCSACLKSAGGAVKARDVALDGRGGRGVVLEGLGSAELVGLQATGFDIGVLLAGGRASLSGSALTSNKVGLEYATGEAEVLHNNIHGNQVNVQSAAGLALKANYLGAATQAAIGSLGQASLRSFLDAPYPHGREIVLADDAAVSPEEREKRFAESRAKGIEAFSARRFGDAFQELTRALEVKPDRDSYLYLVYTQMALGETGSLEATLAQAEKSFPHEVRLYHAHARYLLGQGRAADARSVIEKAMTLNPDDPTLAALKDLAVRAGQEESAGPAKP